MDPNYEGPVDKIVRLDSDGTGRCNNGTSTTCDILYIVQPYTDHRYTRRSSEQFKPHSSIRTPQLWPSIERRLPAAGPNGKNDILECTSSRDLRTCSVSALRSGELVRDLRITFWPSLLSM